MGIQNPRPKLETLKATAAHKVDSRMAPGALKSEDPALLLFLYLKPEDPLCVGLDPGSCVLYPQPSFNS